MLVMMMTVVGAPAVVDFDVVDVDVCDDVLTVVVVFSVAYVPVVVFLACSSSQTSSIFYVDQ